MGVQGVANVASANLSSFPEWEELRQQIYRRAIHFTKGLRFDFREMLSDPVCLRAAGSLMWQLVKPYAPRALIGPGLGAAPLLAAMSLAALDDGCRVNTLMVRDQRKTHNRRRWIEGQRVAGRRPRGFVGHIM
jgi:hypothetical protein